MRKPADYKKLICFSEDSKNLRGKIEQLSTRTGLTESRIMEDCMICGYAFLYGTEEDAEHIVHVMRNRYGNVVDADWLRSLIRSGGK